MTKEELKQYDGKDGRPAYIAYKGKIYDLSSSDFWTGGIHMGRIHAGEDVTDQIGLSPHGEANIFRFKAIDVLEDGENSCGCTGDTCCSDKKEEEKPASVVSEQDQLMIARQKWYKKYHPHPITVHFPMGLFMMAVLGQIISLFLGSENVLGIKLGFFITALSSLLPLMLGILFTVPAIMSGLLSLKINYNWFPNKNLKIKMMLSSLLLIVSITGAYVGYSELNASFSSYTYNARTSLYTIFPFICMAITMGIGFHGGKITWPQDKE